jgi:hypothetical protein
MKFTKSYENNITINGVKLGLTLRDSVLMRREPDHTPRLQTFILEDLEEDPKERTYWCAICKSKLVYLTNTETIWKRDKMHGVGLNKVLEKVWDIINDERTSERARLHALSLAKDCYAMRMNLLESKAEIEQTMQLIFKHQEERQEQVANSLASAHLTEPNDYRLSQCKF